MRAPQAHHPSLARHRTTRAARRAAWRELRAAADQLGARRLNFIDVQRLSTDEAMHLEPTFDPGPEYDA